MTKKEKFMALVSNEKTTTIKEIRKRIKNKEVIDESFQIAIKVLIRLDELKWSQKKLAVEMNVSPQQITKIIKGQENLTIKTMQKLQNALNIPILASFYGSKNEESDSTYSHEEVYNFPIYKISVGDTSNFTKKETEEYAYTTIASFSYPQSKSDIN